MPTEAKLTAFVLSEKQTLDHPQVFDGWVLKGEKFPSSQDHPLPLHQRYTDFCSSAGGGGAASRSSQNVAMVFFRIHSPDSGFTLAVRKLHNPFRESRPLDSSGN